MYLSRADREPLPRRRWPQWYLCLGEPIIFHDGAGLYSDARYVVLPQPERRSQ